VIAAATSTLIAYLEGAGGDDVIVLHAALSEHQVVLPPAVLTETLSDPALPPAVRALLASLPLLGIEPGYWERAGLLRARILAQRRKARVADALIAQSCLDHGVPLLTRDKDLRNFARATDLSLL
jgi:predicted nucleic acid-binding protein